MTDRIPLDDLTSDQYDQLCDDVKRFRLMVSEYGTGASALAEKLRWVRDLANLWLKRTDQLRRGGELLSDVLDRPASGTALPASTAPLAAGLPLVRGRCPACGRASLFLGSGGHATCSIIDCPDPCAADKMLHGELQIPGSRPATPAALTPGPCPACRRADQAGLAPTEQHRDCLKEQP